MPRLNEMIRYLHDQDLFDTFKISCNLFFLFSIEKVEASILKYAIHSGPILFNIKDTSSWSYSCHYKPAYQLWYNIFFFQQISRTNQHKWLINQPNRAIHFATHNKYIDVTQVNQFIMQMNKAQYTTHRHIARLRHALHEPI